MVAEKLLEQLNQPEAHLYQIDVQSDEEVINGFQQMKMLAILMVYIIDRISANMEDLTRCFF